MLLQIFLIEEEKEILHSMQEKTVVSQEAVLELAVGDVKMQRSEMLLKQHKQENHKGQVTVLLKKLKEEERFLTKVQKGQMSMNNKKIVCVIE